MQKFWAIPVVFFSLYVCAKRKEPDRSDQARMMLEQFFNAPQGEFPNGLWFVDRRSAAEVMEKKFLSNYSAKPDELKLSEIRDRLKNLNIFIRIQNAEITMMTSVADSFGVSTGSIARNGREYTALLRGKGNPVRAKVMRAAGKTEILLYDESGMVLQATRELRPVTDLVREFTEQAMKATGLAQY